MNHDGNARNGSSRASVPVNLDFSNARGASGLMFVLIIDW
jgi:hypothetical protein